MSNFPIPKGSDRRVRRALQKISKKYGGDATPIYASVKLTDLTASSLVATDPSKVLSSVTIGTGLDYTHPTLSLSHLGIESLTDPGADRIFFWDESENATKFLSVGNSLAITTTTLDTIQDIRTTASPTFSGLDLSDENITGVGDISLDSLTADDTSITMNSPVMGISLSEIENLEGDKTFIMASKILTWTFTNPIGGMKWEWLGGASGHLFELLQETGNPSAGTHLAHLEATNTDVLNLHIQHHGVGGTEVFLISDDSSDNFIIDNSGNITSAGTGHDIFSDFVADEHVAHSGVTLTAGNGLSGGGDITTNRTFSLDLNELGTETTIASGDFIAMVDITDSGSQKITFANFEGTIDHSNITNTHNLTTDIDHDQLTNTHNLTTDIDHDQLTNFDSNEHFLQTAITNVSTALSTGLLKVTTGTGALSVITDNSTNWNTAYGWGDHADQSYISSNPQSGEYKITGLRLASDGQIIVTYDSTPEP